MNRWVLCLTSYLGWTPATTTTLQVCTWMCVYRCITNCVYIFYDNFLTFRYIYLRFNTELIIHRFVVPCCWAKIYTGHITCCPLVSHGEYADGTDRRMPDCYIVLSAKHGHCYNMYIVYAWIISQVKRYCYSTGKCCKFTNSQVNGSQLWCISVTTW